MSWSEVQPENDDQVKGFGEVVRSHKTEFRAGLRKHFYWDDADSSGTEGATRNTATPTAPGSARAFFDVESNVSAHRDGSLFITSDTSRLYGLTSSFSFLLGSTRAIQFQTDSATSTPLDTDDRVLVQRGVESGNTTATYNVAFPTEYNGVPLLSASINRLSETGNTGLLAVSAVTAGGFTYITEITSGAGNEVYWRSVGSVGV